MEKFVNYEAESEKNFSDEEVIKVTRKVIQQLVLWGFVAFNPLSTMDAKAQGINTKDYATSEKAISFENSFKNEGLLSLRQERHDKPTVVVTTRSNIEAHYSEQGGLIKTDKSLASELGWSLGVLTPLLFYISLQSDHFLCPRSYQPGLAHPET